MNIVAMFFKVILESDKNEYRDYYEFNNYTCYTFYGSRFIISSIAE